jgi:hypothetical protein
MTIFTADDRADGSVVVSARGVELFTYVYRSPVAQLESPRPYLHPVNTLSGQTVTELRPHDHVWHAGLSWSLPNAGDHNFWGGPTFVRDRGYEQLPNNGRVDHRGFTAFEATDAGVELEEQLQWMSQAGAPVFTERRRLSATIAPDLESWMLVFDSVMRNVSGETIGIGSPSTEGRENAGYGGLFWRGPASMRSGTVLSPGITGGEERMGSRGDWMGYSAEAATVVMVEHASNPRHPTPWFVRTEEYAGLCPAPFFTERLVVAAGEKVRFRYSVVVADGASDLDRATALAAIAAAQTTATDTTPAEQEHS